MSSVAAGSNAGPGFRGRLASLVRSSRFESFIITLIAINAITLGLETSETVMSQFGPLLHVIDRIILNRHWIPVLIEKVPLGVEG